MQKCLLLSVAVYWLTEAAPVNLGSLEFDKLDTDLKNLKYEVEEEDLDDFSKLLDEAGSAESTTDNKQAKTNVKASGFKRKDTSNKRSKSKHNIDDLKKFFKTAGVHDQGAYDDDETYALAEAFAGTAVGIKGKEDRKYRKGTKTRGFHRVHHKDEYKKDKLFYEDDEISGTINKVGAKEFGRKIGAGAKADKGRFHHDHQKGIFGKQGYSDNGSSNKEFNEFSDSQGFDGTFSNVSR